MADAGNGRTARSFPAAAHLTALAAIVALPLLLLVGMLLYRSVTLEDQQTKQRVSQVLEGLVADVDRDIDRRVSVLETLSTSPLLVAEDWPAFYRQARESLQGRAFLVLVDIEGRQLVNTFVPFGGEPAMTGNPETVKRMRDTGRPVVSDLFTSLVVRQPVYNVSIPVRRGDDLRFVMSLGLLPEDLRDLLQSQGLPPQWSATIWDSRGIVMARTRDHARLLGTAVPPRLVDQTPERVIRTADIDGEKVLAAVGHTGLAGWGIAVTVAASQIDEQLAASVWLWGATILAVSGLVVGLAFLFGRGLTRPLVAARQAALALGRGEPLSIGPSRITEIDAVNDALRRARQELDARSAALRRNEEQLRTAAEAAQFGVHEYDVVHDRTHRSPQFLEILGAGPEAASATFEGGLGFVHPDDREATRERKRAILDGGGDRYQLDYRILRPDGQVRWVMDRGRVIRDADGQALNVVGVVLDITALKDAEQRQRLLFDELNHRVKNTLSIVQALAQQTLRTRPDPADFNDAFAERLASLARAHSLLTNESWQGAPLQEIVSAALEPFMAEAGRIRIAGPPVRIPASGTITLSLMLHELATNAAKYGALSNEAGHLSIAWEVREERAGIAVDLRWQEEDGPPVVPPASRGFGSRLLAGSVRQLNAQFDSDYAAHGFRCRLRFPVPRSVEAPAQ
ncbi:sensor histidine kinase [Reyranella sp.]|uniref:sensor histidine kinase n=1 Tax=Reyranella sp. TaxID=1929291 RepID=UPI003BACD392